MKRHQLLGKDLRTSLEVCLQCLADTEVKCMERAAAGQPQADYRAMLLDNALSHAVLEHLGYGPIDGLRSRLERGVDQAVEFFCSRWWTHENDGQGLDPARPDYAPGMWWPLLPTVWLLCGLTERWDDASTISAAVDAPRAPEWLDCMQDDDYLYMCMASHLRPEPIQGVADLLAKLKATKQKRIRLVWAAWEAAVARDQQAFNKTLKESVAHFLKAEAEDVPNVNFWVGVRQSLVWLIAERNGLPFPPLPEKSDAAVVRRQTVGVAEAG